MQTRVRLAYYCVRKPTKCTRTRESREGASGSASNDRDEIYAIYNSAAPARFRLDFAHNSMRKLMRVYVIVGQGLVARAVPPCASTRVRCGAKHNELGKQSA